MSIPLIDIFAGPGGLGEGFCSVRAASGERAFRISLSVEKDSVARETLRLRSFVRSFDSGPPSHYYDLVRSPTLPLSARLQALYDRYPDQARSSDAEAWKAELGEVDVSTVRDKIDRVLNDEENWALIGGPPCQAYSLVGRARNSGNPEYRAEKDPRQHLYLEYLQILADHRPAVFVMENVKGLLSATLKSQRIFDRMLEDLSRPSLALRRKNRHIRTTRKPLARYKLLSAVQPGDLAGLKVTDFVVPMEDYGIPQTRHRVIIIGIREDLGVNAVPLLNRKLKVSLRSVLSDLPRLRSGLSEKDDSRAWTQLIRGARDRRWFSSATHNGVDTLHDVLSNAISRAVHTGLDRGGEFLAIAAKPAFRSEWFVDEKLGGVLHHRARVHMEKDIHRYLFAACFANSAGRTPTLRDFPADLLPKHENVQEAVEEGCFSDRFRVQLWDQPASTVTSHLAKDGHYFIHPDPQQCRALTVREAARLQTFPDNYFFCGPRTAQYTQVGNAVPPMLAHDIGELVFVALRSAGAS